MRQSDILTAVWHHSGHRGLPDPARATGPYAEKALVFAQTYAALRRRIASFVDLPFEARTGLALQAGIDHLGLDETAAQKA